MSEKKNGGLKKVGGLWKQTAKSGLGYYSGNIELGGRKTKILLFQNRDKKAENSPDLTISIAVDDDGGQQRENDQPPHDDIPF